MIFVGLHSEIQSYSYSDNTCIDNFGSFTLSEKNFLSSDLSL